VKVKLLKNKPYQGKSSRGDYFLYSVDVEGMEHAFFAPVEIHELIQSAGIAVNSDILLKKVGSKIELSLLGVATAEPKSDDFREMMRQSILDALELKRTIEGVEWTHEDVRSLSSTLFIARSRVG